MHADLFDISRNFRLYLHANILIQAFNGAYVHKHLTPAISSLS